MQQKVLKRLIEHGRHTEYGRKFGMQSSRYEDFAQGIPVVSYEELKGDIDRMRHGEANVLWPGRVNGMQNHQEQPTTRASLSLSLKTD